MSYTHSPFQPGDIVKTPTYGNIKPSTIQICERIEKNGKFLEFIHVSGYKELYSVIIYDFYPGNNSFFMPNQRRIIKDSGILYDFGKAYNIFKKYKEIV